MRIRRLGPGDEQALELVGPLFDGPVLPEAATRFMNTENHHILVAYEGDAVAGFVTGVETTHPDKGTEMFLYELAVDPKFRRKGYAAHLVRALAQLARERHCYGMWVGTEHDNLAAIATYRNAGAAQESATLFVWTFGDSRSRLRRSAF